MAISRSTTVSGSGGLPGELVAVSQLVVESGAVASNTNVGRLGDVDVFGTAIGTTLSGIETTFGPQLSLLVVESGGVASNTSAGPSSEVDVFGTAIGTTLSGTQQASFSPVEFSQLVVESGGVASNTSAGPLSEVDVFGTAIGTTLSGVQGNFFDPVEVSQLVVESGGVTSNTSVGPFGKIDVFGTAIGTTLSGANSGVSQLVVESGGVASSTAISANATEQVNAGGFDNSARISGGTQYDYGSASGDTIYGGGFQIVESGGTAIGTTISGGTEYVSSGGTAISTRINSGGLEVVSAGGIASGTTINGGMLEVASGGSTGSGPITFANAGGILRLDDSQHFHGLIAGFASPSGVTEEIDLGDIVFSKRTHATFKEDKNHLSGTLTVTDGTHTANLTLLGQYSTGNFSLASDGHGGTVVTDPLIGSAGHAALFAAQT